MASFSPNSGSAQFCSLHALFLALEVCSSVVVIIVVVASGGGGHDGGGHGGGSI